MNNERQQMREILRNGGTLSPCGTERNEHHSRVKAQKPKQISTGRFQTMNSFVDHSARFVDTTAQATWLVLFREIRNGRATISQGQIAERIGVSRRTAIRAIQHLEDAGLIMVVKRGKIGGGSSTYQVHGTPQHTPKGCDTSVTGGVTKSTNS